MLFKKIPSESKKLYAQKKKPIILKPINFIALFRIFKCKIIEKPNRSFHSQKIK